MQDKKPHGGIREGSGRPKGYKKNVSFWCDPKYKEVIRKFIKTLDYEKN
jgi:ABC-type transport system substrate-binding protein